MTYSAQQVERPIPQKTLTKSNAKSPWLSLVLRTIVCPKHLLPEDTERHYGEDLRSIVKNVPKMKKAIPVGSTFLGDIQRLGWREV